MKKRKLNLAVIFGGKSAEHEVSIVSASNVVRALDKKKYNLSLVGLSKRGDWFSFDRDELLSGKIKFSTKHKAVIPYSNKGKFFLKIGKTDKQIDVVFPVLHGPYGEDGTIQGMLKFFNVPFVGPGVLGSSLNMDKVVSKQVLHEAGLPVVKFLAYTNLDKNKISFAEVKKKLSLPFFVKPANLGSSVGISKVKNKNEFTKAIREAFLYDSKIIIEEAILGKEIECAVLGNERPKAAVPGEVAPTHDFYSYDAKYIDDKGADLIIPARLSKAMLKKIQRLAVESYKILCCEGMSRVDFFVTSKNKIYVNEINTIPGFTAISMYPKMWENSGLPYTKLIDRLIELAFKRFKRESKLKVDR